LTNRQWHVGFEVIAEKTLMAAQFVSFAFSLGCMSTKFQSISWPSPFFKAARANYLCSGRSVAYSTWVPEKSSHLRDTSSAHELTNLAKTNMGFYAVFRIHDILVWIRIEIRGSMTLSNGSGSGFGSGSCYFRHWPNKKFKFFCFLLFEDTFTSFFKDIKKSQTEGIAVFLTIIAYYWGGPKTCGSGGSRSWLGSGTLFTYITQHIYYWSLWLILCENLHQFKWDPINVHQYLVLWVD
jgi:hypothetical protein